MAGAESTKEVGPFDCAAIRSGQEGRRRACECVRIHKQKKNELDGAGGRLLAEKPRKDGAK